MVDRVLTDGGRRLAAVTRLEDAVRRFATDIAFGPDGAGDHDYGDPNGPQLLRDIVVTRSNKPDAERGDALTRLRRHVPKLQRASFNLTTANFAGLLREAPLPGFVLDAARAMAAPYLAVIDRLQTAPLTPGARPWVPIVPPIIPAAELPAEKTELGSQAIDVPGSVVTPTPVGDANNIAWAAFNTDELRDTLLAVVAGRTIAGITAGILADLAATTSTAPTIGAAIDELADAGYPASLIVADRAGWLNTAGIVPQSGATYAGLEVVFGPTPATLVMCSPAVWCQVMLPDMLELAEPSIGGYEVSAPGAYVVGFPPAAVVKVVAA